MSNKYRKSARLIRAVLVSHFPNCFCPKRTKKRPLKIGIFEDILAYFPEMEKGDLQAALADYTRGPSYQSMMIDGAQRLDLNGAIVGYVTAEEAVIALGRMDKMYRRLSKPQTEIGAQIDG